MTDVGQRVVRDLRNLLFGHILTQSVGFFATQTTGRLMSRITNDVSQIQQAVSETLGDLARESLALVGYIAILVYNDAASRDGVPDQRAAGRLPTGSAGAVRAQHDAAKPGSAGAARARERGGLRRPPHREGLRRGSARGRPLRAHVAPACIGPTCRSRVCSRSCRRSWK